MSPEGVGGINREILPMEKSIFPNTFHANGIMLFKKKRVEAYPPPYMLALTGRHLLGGQSRRGKISPTLYFEYRNQASFALAIEICQIC